MFGVKTLGLRVWGDVITLSARVVRSIWQYPKRTGTFNVISLKRALYRA